MIKKIDGNIFAVASEGGHWKQLRMVIYELEYKDINYITTNSNNIDEEITSLQYISDCNRNELKKMFLCFLQTFAIFNKQKPSIVITTGALPGLICIFWGRVFGAKTLWLDSYANATELSMCGKLAKRISSEVLTQWEHLADGKTVLYKGRVI